MPKAWAITVHQCACGRYLFHRSLISTDPRPEQVEVGRPPHTRPDNTPCDLPSGEPCTAAVAGPWTDLPE